MCICVCIYIYIYIYIYTHINPSLFLCMACANVSGTRACPEISMVARGQAFTICQELEAIKGPLCKHSNTRERSWSWSWSRFGRFCLSPS